MLIKMAKSFKYKLRDPRTCRVFFSSPFGGMEAERDELMRKYLPQIQHLCQSRGVEFVPVDMRWGITEEAADKAQTITICLREIDRCDMFVGFYGQRYGWHGMEDRLLQRNIDLAAGRYKWLKDKRDISVTEIEFLHGHLNKPGQLPACFCFRDKGYDEKMAASLEASGDKKQAEKFQCESENARKKIETLKHRVEATRNKSLAVHMDYFTPEEGANHMFNAIFEHVSALLDMGEELDAGGKDTQTQTADQDKFLSSRQSLYVGGDKYFRLLDKAIQTGASRHVLVTGTAGQGKSALLANWVVHVKKNQPKVIVVYHFIGSSQFSDKTINILTRLAGEVSHGLQERSKLTTAANLQSPDKGDIRQLMAHLQEVLLQAQQTKQTVVMVLDGLDKAERGSKTAKTLFWLPASLPKTAKMVLSTVDTDSDVIEELVSVRHYNHVTLTNLDVKQRKEICESALAKWGKALSKQQMDRVVGKPQISNPRHLSILVTELAMFGSFRQLDEKIDSLLESHSLGELCGQLLERLEVDCNTADHPSVVQQVLPLLLVSRQGLMESEVTEIVDIPVHVWLPLFFALEQYILMCSGLMRFVFSELSLAVETRYLAGKTDRSNAVRRLVKYFDEKRKSLPLWPKPSYSLCRRPAYELPWLQQELEDRTGLKTILTDLNIFHTLMVDNHYVVLELWKWTDVSFQDITDLYLDSFDKGVAQLTINKKAAETNGGEPPAMKLLYHLENVYQFLNIASYSEGVIKVCNKIIRTLERLKAQCKEQRRKRLVNEYRYHLACCLSDVGRYPEARTLHLQVIQYWRDAVAGRILTDIQLGETRLAWALNGLGLVQYHQKNYSEAEQLFKESESCHKKHGNKKNEADCQVNLGLIHLVTKVPQQAVENFLAAIKLYEDVHFDSVPHIIGNVYTNLGLAYRRMDNLDLAEKHYKRSLEIKANAVGWDHPSIATAYMNLGTVEMCRKHWPQMEVYTLKAINIFKVNGYRVSSTEYRQCQENLVQSYLKQAKYDVAKSDYWSVFDALTDLGVMDQCLPWVHNTMAKYYLDTGNYSCADRILTQLVHSSKRTAATFLYLDQLDQKRPPPTQRKQNQTLDHGLALFPDSSQLLKQKVMTYYIGHGDVDGAMKYWASVSAGPGDYATLVDWCKEADKPDIAADVLQRALVLFPNLG